MQIKWGTKINRGSPVAWLLFRENLPGGRVRRGNINLYAIPMFSLLGVLLMYVV